VSDRSAIGASLARTLPFTARANRACHLEIGGCDCVELARQFGTPLYVFDEATLRRQCRTFRRAFERRHDDVCVLYASKAFLHPALLAVFQQEGLGLDVVSAGELYVARRAGFPLDRVYFHGNNKTPEELAMALDWGVGRVVVDNDYELERLNRLAGERGATVEVLLRLTPGVDPHTHAHNTTGTVDSKFGLAIAGGQAARAVERLLEMPALCLVGLHAHIGSQIDHLAPYRQTLRTLVSFAAGIRDRCGVEIEELSPGGGWAIRYTEADEVPAIEEIAATVVDTLRRETGRHELPLPRLVVEPGRSIVGRAGVALYTVGGRKQTPGLRTYVFIDGGLADNVRPAMYGARYQALAASKMGEPATEEVTIAGKYCESGDVLIRDLPLPPLQPGDLLAVPAAGAYCLSLANNYNMALRPAIVLVKDGQAQLIRRRERYEDLLRNDVWQDSGAWYPLASEDWNSKGREC